MASHACPPPALGPFALSSQVALPFSARSCRRPRVRFFSRVGRHVEAPGLFAGLGVVSVT